MSTLAPISRRLHVCSYYCNPHKHIHCMPVMSAPYMNSEEETSFQYVNLQKPMSQPFSAWCITSILPTRNVGL
jgi:hypothetical protein